MNRSQRLWVRLRASFWFVPSIFMAAAIVAALLLLRTGSTPAGAPAPQTHTISPDSARSLLSTTAGSMITVVGVTFSVILVTLSLASSQYSSRIIRNFMRDRATQTVLGIFAAIFTYCLIVLRAIPDADSGPVPIAAVTFALILALVGISFLIFFVHHTAASIQASSVVGAATAEALAAIDRGFPEDDTEHPAHDTAPPDLPAHQWRPVPAWRDGYIQSVNNTLLIQTAAKETTTVRLERRVGAYVVKDATIAWIATAAPPSPGMTKALRTAVTIDCYRTIEQDPGYGARQLVDIALRALSPSMNDTTTATMCVDHLTAILSRVATRAPQPTHHFHDGALRLITLPPTFEGLLGLAFNQIRASAEANTAILMQMLAGLHTIDEMATRTDEHRVIREHVDHIAEAARRCITAPSDLARFEYRLHEVLRRLEQQAPSGAGQSI